MSKLELFLFFADLVFGHRPLPRNQRKSLICTSKHDLTRCDANPFLDISIRFQQEFVNLCWGRLLVDRTTEEVPHRMSTFFKGALPLFLVVLCICVVNSREAAFARESNVRGQCCVYMGVFRVRSAVTTFLLTKFLLSFPSQHTSSSTIGNMTMDMKN